MHDQAKSLRGLMEHRSQSLAHSAPESMHQTIAVTSGKGGVGKSHLALNLAIALAHAGKSVLLMDINPGVGNLEILCGLNSPWNLSHVLAGSMSLAEILMEGPSGIAILPGAGILENAQDESSCTDVMQSLDKMKGKYQFTILDLGMSNLPVMSQWINSADRALMVTTTEPASLAEAYAFIKRCPLASSASWEILTNQALSAGEAETIFQRFSHTARAFLQTELNWAGWIPFDAHIRRAAIERVPCLMEFPYCPASESLRLIAHGFLNPIAAVSASPNRPHIFPSARSPFEAAEKSQQVMAP